MKYFLSAYHLLFLGALMLFACDDEEQVIEMPADGEFIISESFFNDNSLLSFEMVEASLADGTTADCFRLTFSSNPVASGPFCPETIDDLAGMAVYDGATGPGLRAISAALLNDMEADGYNIVNDDGTVNVDNFDGTASRDVSNCLDAAPDDDLVMTYIVPAVPKLATSNQVIGEVEFIGFSNDGVPIAGDPPSAINGPMMGPPGTGNSTEISFPSIDPCGGHHDPAGYYHWHFVPEVVNQVLEANGITEIECTNVAQTSSVALHGFARDGYPIYAYATEPTDLDDCGGRTAATPEFPDGVYHYVASTTSGPNVPGCLKGVAASNSFRFG